MKQSINSSEYLILLGSSWYILKVNFIYFESVNVNIYASLLFDEMTLPFRQ